MKRLSLLSALFVATPALAFAHVSVSPREAKPGAEQQYTVRVPTEGQVSTTAVYLQVPDRVTVTEVVHPEGAAHEVKKDGDRIVGITWTKEIPAKQSAQFLFTAKNPAAAGEITWKVQQRFADGTSRDWTPGTKLTDTPTAAPIPGTVGAAAGQATAHTGEAAVIEKWLAEYDAAFNARDLEKLGTFYHADVTVYEGGGINNGWVDYRDRHLGPELKEFQNLQFGHTNRRIHVLGDGRSAYAVAAYSLKAKMGERDIDSGGLETLVLVKGDDGRWKIRHSHTSARARRPPQ